MRWQDTSHPDIAPFHHDLYRGVGRGRFWVMEQQPGPVNWARWNPAPAPGMVRLWTLEAHAHGADVVSYFRWRQAPFAQEQMHAGLNLPHAHELSPGGREAAAAAEDLARLGDLPASARAPVAIVYDYEAHWIPRFSRRARTSAIRNWSFAGTRRSAVSGSTSISWPRARARRLSSGAGALPADRLGGRRERIRRGERNRRLRPALRVEDQNFRFPKNCRPGRCSASLRSRVVEVSSMRPGARSPLAARSRAKRSAGAKQWRPGRKAREFRRRRARPSSPTTTIFYLACWPDPAPSAR